MPAFKDLAQKLVDTPFVDFDTCYLCGSHNGPFVWVIKQGRGKKRIFFLCEECYEKTKGTG